MKKKFFQNHLSYLLSYLLRLRLFLGLYFFFLPAIIYSQIHFTYLKPEDGLYSGNIHCILQDFQGFIWIGTEDGLHRFDGNSIVPYRHNPKDSTSINNNFIFLLFEDSKKNLWVGTTGGGLSLYDRDHDCFIPFGKGKGWRTTIKGSTVFKITEGPDNNLFVGMDDGNLNHFKIPDTPLEKPEIKSFRLPQNGVKLVNAISDVVFLKNGTILLSTDGHGIYGLDPGQKDFYRPFEIFKTGRISRIFVDSKNRLWIGTWDQGIFVFDLDNNRQNRMTEEDGLAQNQIVVIAEDHEGSIWIGTDNGLNLLRYDQDPFDKPKLITYQENKEESSSLLGNAIKAIEVDKDDRLWIGSYYKGVNIYNKNAPNFHSIRHKLSHTNVTSFVYDKAGNIWIGTDGGGINILKGNMNDIYTSTLIRPVLIHEKSKREVTKIKCMSMDSNGNVWAGTWGSGVFRINPVTYAFEHFVPDAKTGLLSSEIISADADVNGNMWLGSFGTGLFYFDSKLKKFTHFGSASNEKPDMAYDRVFAVHRSRDGKVYVGREDGGFSLVDIKTNSFKLIQNEVLEEGISVNTISETKDGILWLGTTSDGFVSYDPQTGETKRFDESMGLANSFIHSIVEADDGMLWISTNKGLSRFDRKNLTFTNFTIDQGLQGSQFNINSSTRFSDGTVVFGGTEGLNFFHPKDIQLKSTKSEIVFTGFWVNNVPYTVKNHQLPLNITLIDRINLDHRQNAFSIEFADLNFNFETTRQYAFMLEGFQTEWQFIGNERKITFTNLPPGEFRLRVKASNGDHEWIEKSRPLDLYIKPAWWQTIWFKAALVLFGIATVILATLVRVRFILRQKAILKALVAERTAELKVKNDELANTLRAISEQNEILNEQQVEIASMNNEIQAQNEELTAQNEHISHQRAELQLAQDNLKLVNDQLEKLVDERTKKLKSTIRELDKTVFELDRFVYSASHDLSAPLKSILGLISLAKKEKTLDAIQEYHEYIEKSIFKLELVIKSMVEFSRNSHMTLHSEPIHLHYFVDEIINELQFLPEAAPIEFYNAVPEGCIINSDTHRLRIVLQNIITNGIKYADPDKKNNFLKISANVVEDKIYLDVEDNGIGIDAVSVPKIFSMYFRATDKSNGSGLGLFIVKETVRKLGGKIVVKSDLGSGSRFTIVLPFKLEESVKQKTN